MAQILKNVAEKDEWYRITIYRLIEICKRSASKYTRSKVRKAMPAEFAYVVCSVNILFDIIPYYPEKFH